ncbi:hypothetical protein V1264_021548 [Littorina saxatilis]|uniref:Uncharacterized protein n=1 Tax=Littorina saxatilis TaxID=31220 RepID=A0AAN9AIJ2_9CAEN
MYDLLTSPEHVAPPVINLEHDEAGVIELDVSSMTYDDLVTLLRDLGFHRKSASDESVPEEYQNGANPPSDGTTLQQLLDGTSKWSKLVKHPE